MSLQSLPRQRLQDLQRHIEADADLLRQYEEQLRLTEDPRRIQRIHHQIQRQKASLHQYQREMADLERRLAARPPAAGGDGQVQIRDIENSQIQIQGDVTGRDKIVNVYQVDREMLQRIHQILETLNRQYTGLELRLAGGQAALLDRVDAQHRPIIAALLNQMRADQLALVDRLVTAADQGAIPDDEAAELTGLVMQLLAQLATLRGDGPAATPYQEMLAILQETDSQQQRLKLALPIIPGLLTAEAEATLTLLDTLEGVWQRLVAAFSPAD